MALNELQWGRILALAWDSKGFKAAFERDPVDALKKLQEPETKKALCERYGDYILEELGLEGGMEDMPFIDLETMTWDGIDFAGMPGEQLKKCIAGDVPVQPPKSPCFHITKSHAALGEGEKTLTLDEWGRIYARIWMDHRIDEPEMKTYQQDYGLKKNYMERFEKNPVEVVQEITQALNEKTAKKIDYDPKEKRLYAVIDAPEEWPLTTETLRQFVKTGELQGKPLIWAVNKSC